MIARIAADVEADLVFSCPPYWGLERYSDDPADLSNMGCEEFFAAYTAIIARCRRAPSYRSLCRLGRWRRSR